ncbi:hypothetical protein pdam_00024834 [Pocillopora damicornis]|uniref:Uncharacterized protein n=1 Tax=Pocillopora damicornis TaxID=46731 RepID=A0A3M6TJD9_POCDA|nr:hypothetical protein pdam_00024834 [Pocillopora damicornis]
MLHCHTLSYAEYKLLWALLPSTQRPTTCKENWVDHAELLCMENLNYREIIRKYHHLKGTDIEDTDTKSLLLLHVNLGMSDYVEIKTQSL